MQYPRNVHFVTWNCYNFGKLDRYISYFPSKSFEYVKSFEQFNWSVDFHSILLLLFVKEIIFIANTHKFCHCLIDRHVLWKWTLNSALRISTQICSWLNLAEIFSTAIKYQSVFCCWCLCLWIPYDADNVLRWNVSCLIRRVVTPKVTFMFIVVSVCIMWSNNFDLIFDVPCISLDLRYFDVAFAIARGI